MAKRAKAQKAAANQTAEAARTTRATRAQTRARNASAADAEAAKAADAEAAEGGDAAFSREGYDGTESDATLRTAAREHATDESATFGTQPYVAGGPNVKTSKVARMVTMGERSRFR